jgi:zinc transport system ATP-binding protein
MTTDAVPAIAVRGLDFAYGSHAVLTGVDASVAAGEFVSVVGPNGGGKSTLLKLVLGLLRPARGEVRVFGQSPARARRRVGYMPQHAHVDPQFPVTVMDVTLMGRLGPRRRLGPFRADDLAIARRSLAETEAADLGDRRFSDLSGGQRQRVLIARALACEPELLLLDEPTASLDPGVQDDLFELLHRLNERMTVVLVSHDVGVVSRHVDKVLCVSGGVEEHDASVLSGALADLYGGSSGLALVRHDHSHGHDHHGESGPDA